MATIEVKNISKQFGQQLAVDDVTFDVQPGEIFGLLGPNGAGKTTTIRIILDIFKADAGTVSILGGKMTEEKKNQIGYLPEERGLYQDVQLETCLTYLATLKGMKPDAAKPRIEALMKEFDLYDHRKKNIKELSKGMQQKAQLISALAHEPELIIIDEPFTALDPVNTQMVKDLLRDQRQKGKTVVMCTHQMHQVEELCDRLVLINQGRTLLYGKTDDIRQYSGQDILIQPVGELPVAMPGVEKVERHNGAYRVHLGEMASSQDLLKSLVEREVKLEKFEIALPTLDEIFIQVVTQEGPRE
jgi:ABC-2 type transport system ATP-binding protein